MMSISNFRIKITLLLCTILLLLSPSIAKAEVAAVMGLDITPYRESLNGFKAACRCDVKPFIASEMEGVNIVRKITERKPELIIAIGNDALERVQGIKDTPIVYLMILNPPVAANHKNITGISMHISPQGQIAALKRISPDLKNIGVIYDPQKTGDIVKSMGLVFRESGVRLIAKEARKTKDVIGLLNGMKGEIDAIYMLPDLTVVTPETAEYLFLFSMENRIPVITFSEKYLEMGALLSVGIDANDMGRQSWEIAKEVLSGSDTNRLGYIYARKTDVKINYNIARKLGIRIME